MFIALFVSMTTYTFYILAFASACEKAIYDKL